MTDEPIYYIGWISHGDCSRTRVYDVQAPEPLVLHYAERRFGHAVEITLNNGYVLQYPLKGGRGYYARVHIVSVDRSPKVSAKKARAYRRDGSGAFLIVRFTALSRHREVLIGDKYFQPLDTPDQPWSPTQ